MLIYHLCLCVGILIYFNGICFDLQEKYCDRWSCMLWTCHYDFLCVITMSPTAVAPVLLHADCHFLAQSISRISGENSRKHKYVDFKLFICAQMFSSADFVAIILGVCQFW